MKILELFAGSRSIGKVAEEMGHEVFSVDVNAFENIDLVKDIEFLTIDDIPFMPDMIWASPPCTSYSIAASGHHRNAPGYMPKTEFAKKSDRLIHHTLMLIAHFDCIYYIENPRGMLRKMEIMRGIPRTTVTYCSYEHDMMKPTDIWSNNIKSLFNPSGFESRKLCSNNNSSCSHMRQPRGSNSNRSAYVKSKIPKELCKEIIISATKENFLS
jgi:site-specific DNA-cytosine methylase